ncbi:MAG: Na/Pi cotransporter family protein [Spirochaetes bacterium]|nr:Na/Pi cotransporter family protein [Spirochaetota bacterium]MBN2772117.1 Na/Pi cotransporter family protein [Spirochaetota bacterium]
MSLADVAVIAGGAGLFLLGMNMMTEGLKAFAGDNLKNLLARFTRGRFSSVALGAVVTTMVQSSHVTTIAAIGFVGAGMISFHNSLGIIFGANLGTTTIGWIVSLLGFKLKIAVISLPIITVGAMMRLLSNDRLNYIGTVFAGFGLIFVGIDFLQTGMTSLVSYIDLGYFNGYTVFGRFMLVMVGVLMTLIMQSSGAAITMTLAALFSSGITIEQGAALVIGQNIGTTLTAALAGIGGTVQSKRTALAHVLFNVLSAGIAFVILPFFLSIIEYMLKAVKMDEPVYQLSAFHTSFNILGVMIFLPFIKSFAGLVEKIIPESKGKFKIKLDDSVSSIPSLALGTVKLSLMECLIILLYGLREIITSEHKTSTSQAGITDVEIMLAEVKKYMSRIRTGRKSSEDAYQLHINLLHALEHLEFIVSAALEKSATKLAKTDETNELIKTFDYIIDTMGNRSADIDVIYLEESAKKINANRYKRRHKILNKTAYGELSPENAYSEIESVRWLDRVSYRVWKSVYYLTIAD